MTISSSMGRGMQAILEVAALTSPESRSISVTDVAAALERDRSQVSRTLKTGMIEGFLSSDRRGSYQLGWQLYTDAQALTEQRLRTSGMAALERLVEATGEGCFLGVLSGVSSVTIAERVPTGSNMIGSWLGRPYPAYCSDAGQALLWDCDDDEVRELFAGVDFAKQGPNTPGDVEDFIRRLAGTRARGYSIVDEEAEPDLLSVAVPVRDFRGEIVAAMQVVGPKSRLQGKLEHCAESMQHWRTWLEGDLSSRA